MGTRPARCCARLGWCTNERARRASEPSARLFLATKWRAAHWCRWVRDRLDVAHDLDGAPMSEPAGRANRQHGCFSPRSGEPLIGADGYATGSMLRTTWMAHQ